MVERDYLKRGPRDKIIITLVALVLVSPVLLLLFGGKGGRPDPDLTVEHILENVLEAHGGAEAFEKMSTVRREYRLKDVAGTGETQPSVDYFKLPDNFRIDTGEGRFRKTVVMNGDQLFAYGSDGRLLQVPSGVRDEITDHVRDVFSLFVFDMMVASDQLKYTGRKVALGDKCHVLEYQPDQYTLLRYFISGEDWTLNRRETEARVDSQRMLLQDDFYYFFPRVEGLLFPNAVHYHENGELIRQEFIDDIQVNIDLSEDAFLPPGRPGQDDKQKEPS